MWLRAAVGTVLVAASIGVGVVVFGSQPTVVGARSERPSATTVTTRAISQNPPLPQPSAVPADPNAAVPIVTLGRLSVPRIGLDTPFYEGIWETVIDVGPGHWPGTAEPGGWGNTVIAGHRSTHGQPFRHLDLLVSGDQIVVTTASGTFTYAVTGSRVVEPDEVSIADQRAGRKITLFACHPPGSATHRFVVTGELIS